MSAHPATGPGGRTYVALPLSPLTAGITFAQIGQPGRKEYVTRSGFGAERPGAAVEEKTAAASTPTTPRLERRRVVMSAPLTGLSPHRSARRLYLLSPRDDLFGRPPARRQRAAGLIG